MKKSLFITLAICFTAVTAFAVTPQPPVPDDCYSTPPDVLVAFSRSGGIFYWDITLIIYKDGTFYYESKTGGGTFSCYGELNKD